VTILTTGPTSDTRDVDPPEPAAGGEGSQPASPAVTTPLDDVARNVAAIAMLGAAIIHFAFAPDHLAEETSHGVAFLVIGWLQLLGAGALAFRWRPQRTWLFAAAGVNLAVAALWLLTRTAGLPGEEPEAVSFPDSLASALEVVAAVAALSVAFGWLANRSVPGRSVAVNAVPGVLMIGLVTASVVPALGGGHGHGGAGHDDGHAAAGHDDMAAGDHHGAGGEATEDFAAVRLAALTGGLPPDELDRLRDVNMEYLAGLIRERSDAFEGVPEAEREETIAAFVAWSVDNALTAEEAPADGEATMHSHGIKPWVAITDPAEQLELQAQLQRAGTVIPNVLTAQDALDAGYFQVTPYVPGIGAHYLNVEYLTDDEFDPAKPEMLLYNGNDTSSELVGLSYGMIGNEAPEGFVGPNDEWHEHPSLCIVGTMVVGPDSTPADLCDTVGGEKGMPFRAPMWMGHLWQVPGWESPWGLFSGENPNINLATSDVGK
jgi:hypothetical protein